MNATSKYKSRDRGPDNTTVTISLPKALAAQVDEIAARERRNRSQMIREIIIRAKSLGLV